MNINPLYIILAESVIIFLMSMAAIFLLRLHPQWFRIVRAKMAGKNLVFMIRSDRKSGFVAASYKEDTWVTSFGSFTANPDDIFTYEGSPSAGVYAPYSRAINPKVLPTLRRIRALGITSIQELTFFSNVNLEELRDGKPGKPVYKEEEKKYIRTMKEGIKNIDGQFLDELEVFRVQDVVNFLEESNPTIMDSRIEREVAEELKNIKNPVAKMMPWVIMAMMLMMVGAIVYVMVTGANHSGAASPVAAATHTAAKSVLHL